MILRRERRERGRSTRRKVSGNVVERKKKRRRGKGREREREKERKSGEGEGRVRTKCGEERLDGTYGSPCNRRLRRVRARGFRRSLCLCVSGVPEGGLRERRVGKVDEE